MYLRLYFALALVALASNPVWAQPKNAKQPERYAVLVGVTVYPDLGDEYELDGPGNDVELMRRVLTERFGFPDDGKHIRLLSEQAGMKDAKLLPTLQNIKREFDALARPGVLKPGDQVVVLLAGHGSHQEADWSKPQSYRPDGLDPVFLPRNADFQGEKWKNGLVGSDLREWVSHLTGPRGETLVWVILDSCHSGTMLRAVGKEKTRSIPLERKISKQRLQQIRAEAARRFPKSRGKPQQTELLADTPNVAAIYAAQPTEKEIELSPPGDKEEKTYGLLTYTICSILMSESARSLTYLDLVQRVQQRYIVLGRSYPTPLAEGKFCDRVVLSSEKKLPQRPPIYLSREGKRWRINAGLLHGLNVGSLLAVYSLDAKDEGARPLGYVEVTACRLTEAQVAPCAYQEEKANPDLPEKAICKVVEVSTGDLRLALALDPQTARGEKLPPERADGVLALLRQLAEPKEAPVKLQAQPDEHCWLVRMDALASGRLFLVPPDQQTASVPVRYGPVPAGAKGLTWLKEKTAQITRAKNLLKVVSRWKERGDAQADAQAVKVTLEVVLLKDGKETAIPAGTRPDFQDGEEIGLRVRNQSTAAVDINLLFVDSDFGIEPFFPKTPGTDNRVAPGDKRFFKVEVTSEAVGVDNWVLIAVKAAPNTPRTDFVYLKQPSLEKARSGAEGKTRGKQISKMDLLLLKALFPTATTRGAIQSVSSNCAVELLSYQSSPRKKE
jgi:hypothetical protein